MNEQQRRLPFGGRGGNKPNIDHKKRAMLLAMHAQSIVEECQIWSRTCDRKGYGRVWFGGKWRLAHDVMWEVVNGPLSPDLRLDHYIVNVAPEACRKACVNLLHVEPVTDAENLLRGQGACAVHARQTHCKHGHLLTFENCVPSSWPRRVCRLCARKRRLVAG